MQQKADTESRSRNPDTDDVRIDWFIFTVGSLLLLMVVIPIVIAPELSEKMVASAFTFVTGQIGVWYVISGFGIFIYLMSLTISQKGRIVLGPPGVTADYSNFS